MYQRYLDVQNKVADMEEYEFWSTHNGQHVIPAEMISLLDLYKATPLDQLTVLQTFDEIQDCY